jgi:hypothetical protein
VAVGGIAVRGQSRQSPPDLGTVEEELPWEKSLNAPSLIHRPDVNILYEGLPKRSAKQHGIREVTPELQAKVKAAIRDEK